MTELIAALRAIGKQLAAPLVSTTLVLIAIGLSGFVALGLAWRGAAATPFVPFQTPYIVSGGLVGLGLLVLSLGLLTVHVNRAEGAERHMQTEVVLRQAVELLAIAPAARARRDAARGVRRSTPSRR